MQPGACDVWDNATNQTFARDESTPNENSFVYDDNISEGSLTQDELVGNGQLESMQTSPGVPTINPQPVRSDLLGAHSSYFC